MKSNPHIARALAALTDGQPIDWRELESHEASPGSRETLRALRLVADVRHSLQPPCEQRVQGTPPPHAWGPLDLLEQVASGLHGEVFRAWDRHLEREVALKLLWRPPAHEQVLSQAAVEEARLLARVRHPNVVAIYGADRIDGRAGLWMEFLRGRTLLQEVTDRGSLGGRAAARTLLEVCGGLIAVHAAGLVHGDVKAQNVVREEGGRLVLLDLGCARVTGDQSGASQGTLAYIAPEVAAGGPPSTRSDIYSAGVLLFFLATGRYPNANGRLAGRELRHGGQNPSDADEGLSELLASIVDRALQARPEARHADAGELASALMIALDLRPMAAGSASNNPKAGASWAKAVGGSLVFAALLVASVAFLARQAGAVRDSKQR